MVLDQGLGVDGLYVAALAQVLLTHYAQFVAARLIVCSTVHAVAEPMLVMYQAACFSTRNHGVKFVLFELSCIFGTVSPPTLMPPKR